MTLPRAEVSNPNFQEDSRRVGAGAVDVDVSGMDWRKYHRIGRQYGARRKSEEVNEHGQHS